MVGEEMKGSDLLIVMDLVMEAEVIEIVEVAEEDTIEIEDPLSEEVETEIPVSEEKEEMIGT